MRAVFGYRLGRHLLEHGVGLLEGRLGKSVLLAQLLGLGLIGLGELLEFLCPVAGAISGALLLTFDGGLRLGFLSGLGGLLGFHFLEFRLNFGRSGNFLFLDGLRLDDFFGGLLLQFRGAHEAGEGFAGFHFLVFLGGVVFFPGVLFLVFLGKFGGVFLLSFHFLGGIFKNLVELLGITCTAGGWRQAEHGILCGGRFLYGGGGGFHVTGSPRV